MRNDPASVAQIEPGSIVQVIPTDDNRDFGGRLAEVVSVETWGVVAAIRTVGVGSTTGVHRFPWSMIEPTGGKIVFTHDGKRIADAPKQKHHP